VKVRGDRATDTAVDADDAAVQVKERAARVAAHQGAVGADVGLLDVEVQLDDPADANHGSAAGLVATGVAGGDAPLTLLEIGRLAHLEEGPVGAFRDLDHAAIDVVVGAEGLRFHLAAVVEDDLALLVGCARDVASGQDVAILADDDAAALGGAHLQADDARLNPFQHRANLLLERLEVLEILRGVLFEDGRNCQVIRRPQVDGRGRSDDAADQGKRQHQGQASEGGKQTQRSARCHSGISPQGWWDGSMGQAADGPGAQPLLELEERRAIT